MCTDPLWPLGIDLCTDPLWPLGIDLCTDPLWVLTCVQIHCDLLVLTCIQIHCDLWVLTCVQIHCDLWVLTCIQIHCDLWVLTCVQIHCDLWVLTCVQIHCDLWVLTCVQIHCDLWVLTCVQIHCDLWVLTCVQIHCDLWVLTCVQIVHYFKISHAPKLLKYVCTECCILGYTKSTHLGLRRLRSSCTSAQSVQSLQWGHMPTQSELPWPILRAFVESDHGCTSRIFFDNTGDNVTLTVIMWRWLYRNHVDTITSVIAANQMVINEVYVFLKRYFIKNS